MPLGDVWPGSTRKCRQRPLRVLLVPAHRGGPDQAQQPRGPSTGRPLSGSAGGATTCSCPEHGLRRAAPRRPARLPHWRRPYPASRRGCSRRGEYIERSTGLRPPRSVRFREMEYGVPRARVVDCFADSRSDCGRLPHRIPFPIEVRFAAADDIWLSTRTAARRPTSPSTSTPAAPTSRTSAPSNRCAPAWVGGRTGASCTGATPPRCARRTRALTSSSRCATASTPTAFSPTTMSNASSARDDWSTARRSAVRLAPVSLCGGVPAVARSPRHVERAKPAR